MPASQRKVLRALGLRKSQHTVVQDDNPAINGMIFKVNHLVEVERVSTAQMEEWRLQYPEAFEKEYDPASGLRFNAWVEGV